MLVVFLTACKSKPHSIGPNQADLDRVANILDQPKTELMPILDSIHRLSIDRFSETRIALMNALKLGNCRLFPLIAERNSSLGKQKQESIRLIYEWKIAAGLKACKSLKNEPWFKDALLSKQDDVEIAVINLLLKSQEADLLHSKIYRPFSKFSDSTIAYEQRSEPIRRVLIQALNYETPLSLRETTNFEIALYQWSRTQHHANLRQGVQESTNWLVAANRLQSDAILTDHICPLGTPTPKARRIRLFLNSYFKANIQPQLSAISRSLRSFVSQWSSVQLDTFPNDELSMHLLKLRVDADKRLKIELQRHIKQWQIILKKCQLEVRITTNS